MGATAFVYLIVLASLSIIGIALLITGIVLLFKLKKSHKSKMLFITSIIVGVLFCTPLISQIFLSMGFNTAINIYYNNDAHKRMGEFLTAIDNNDFNKVEKFINNGEDVNKIVEDYNNITPLILAVQKGNYDIVKLLIKSGADINKIGGSNKDTTPLIEAVYSLESKKKDNIEMVKLLLENGANVNMKISYTTASKTALLQSAWYSLNPEIMRLLIKYKADVNVDNGSPLRIIIYSKTRNKKFGRLEFAKILIENGADINAKDSFGKSAMDYAKANDDTKDIALYLERNGTK